MKTLPKNLAPLASLCGKSRRFAVDCVKLDLLDTEYRAEAMNGKVALRVAGEVGADGAPDPRGGTKAVIDAKTWRKVFSNAARDCGCDHVAVSFNNMVAEFVACSTTTVAEVGEGGFPDISGAIPRSSPSAAVSLRAGQLLTLVKAIKEIAGGDAVIEIEVGGKEKPVVLRAAAEGQQLTGLIMPIGISA